MLNECSGQLTPIKVAHYRVTLCTCNHFHRIVDGSSSSVKSSRFINLFLALFDLKHETSNYLRLQLHQNHNGKIGLNLKLNQHHAAAFQCVK